MNFSTRNIKKKGFSLLELVLAVAVFSLGSFVLSTLLIDSNINVRLSSERIEALSYAKEGIEAVESIKNNNWSDLVNGNYGLEGDGGVWIFNGSSDLIDDKYTRTVNITDADPASLSKNVSVSIAWPLTPTRNANVVLNTILTNWK